LCSEINSGRRIDGDISGKIHSTSQIYQTVKDTGIMKHSNNTLYKVYFTLTYLMQKFGPSERETEVNCKE
jgi:hypothetical protein